MRRHLMVLLPLMIWSSSVAAAPTIEEELKALEPTIGAYPPAIKSASQKATIVKRYNALKKRLDAEVGAHPDDLTVRFQRASLENMGHNIDLNGAFEQAKTDYTYVIDHHAGDVPALLGLGTMLVNTNPTYAGDAKALFLSAQCYHGKEPLEEAQRGLFFANYYMGKLPEAKERSRYLVKQWPDNATYRKLDGIVDAVLARSQNPVKVADDPGLETCKGNP